jgi:hypothetical protein
MNHATLHLADTIKSTGPVLIHSFSMERDYHPSGMGKIVADNEVSYDEKLPNLLGLANTDEAYDLASQDGARATAREAVQGMYVCSLLSI